MSTSTMTPPITTTATTTTTTTTNTFISKYKPYFIDDFFLDEKLLFVLKTLIEIDQLNILLIGSPSSGKTTLLYAIIRQYYNLSKDAYLPENNILFINNLKEQGIQYFRNEMKIFCQSHSTIHGKKRMVVIDDIDIINEQSQQVFRNYIDKYKNNINFVFVCTNIQKVIESIQSRLHMLKIENIKPAKIDKIMDRIIKAENICIDDKTKEYLLRISGNSIRINLNYLEKIKIIGYPVDLDMCKKICFNISFEKFEAYFQHLKTHNLVAAIDILYEIYDYGYSVIDILDYFFTFIKLTDIVDEETKYQIIPHICKNTIIFHNIHEDEVELAIFTNNLYHIIEKLNTC